MGGHICFGADSAQQCDFFQRCRKDDTAKSRSNDNGNNHIYGADAVPFETFRDCRAARARA